MAEQLVPANDMPDSADSFVGLDDVARRLEVSRRTVAPLGCHTASPGPSSSGQESRSSSATRRR